MHKLKKDRSYVHHDSVNNNNYYVTISKHMFKTREKENKPRGYMFKTHGQIARFIQYAILKHSLDEYEDKGKCLVEFTFKGYIHCVLLKVNYNPNIPDVVSEIVLITAASTSDLKVKRKSWFTTVKNRISMLEYDLKPHDYYVK